MKNRVAVFLVALMLLLPLGSCAKTIEEPPTMETETAAPKTWQEAYRTILQSYGIATTFWLADADADGTPELYVGKYASRKYNLSVYDFTRGGIVSQNELDGQTLFLDTGDGVLGLSVIENAHSDPLDWNTESYQEWRYADGVFTLISSIRNAQEYARKSESPTLDITSDLVTGRELTQEEFAAGAAAFREKYRQPIPYYSYYDSVDLNKCLRRPPATWQEAYTVNMQHNNDGVSGNFFLLDADRDGTPELYNIMNIRGNEVGVSDFARDITEASELYGLSQMYYNKIEGTLGIYHRDGGPGGDSPGYAFVMPRHECYAEYRYADGKYTCLSWLVRNWATEDVEGTVNIPEFEETTLDGKDISIKEYEIHATHFWEKYSASYSFESEMHHYEDGMDIEACWTQ